MLNGGRRGFWRPTGAKMARQKGLGKAKLSQGPFDARAGLNGRLRAAPIINQQNYLPDCCFSHLKAVSILRRYFLVFF